MKINSLESLDECIREFLTICQIEGKSPATIKAYCQSLKRYSSVQPKDGSPATRARVLEYLASMPHLEPESRHRYFRETRRFFSWALDHGWITTNPFDGLKNIRVPEKLQRPFTVEEVRKLLQATTGDSDRDKRDSALVTVLLDTGVRRAELCGIDLADIDLSGQRLLIRNAKGGHQRVVAFAASCRNILSEYLNRRTESPGRFFWSVDSNNRLRKDSPISASGVRQALLRLGRRANVKHVNPHRFRHTFTTWSLRSNAREIDVQHLLGHKSIHMIRRYSSHYRSEQAAMRHANFSPVDQLLYRTMEHSTKDEAADQQANHIVQYEHINTTPTT